jgi:hypothetical protein
MLHLPRASEAVWRQASEIDCVHSIEQLSPGSQNGKE